MAGYRLATYEGKSGPRAGLIVGETMFDAAELTGESAYATVLGILGDWPRASELLRGAAGAPAKAKGWPLSETHLRAPLLWPGAIYCAGANYRDHAAEMARRMNRPPEADPKASGAKPWHFLKSPRSIADPGATIAALDYCKNLDWEIELAAVIGRIATKVSV